MSINKPRHYRYGQSRGGKSELQKKSTNQEIELGVSEVEQSENLRELHNFQLLNNLIISIKTYSKCRKDTWSKSRLGITARTFPCVWRPGDHRIAGEQTGKIHLVGTKLLSKAWHSDVSPDTVVNKPRERMLGHYEMFPLDLPQGKL